MTKRAVSPLQPGQYYTPQLSFLVGGEEFPRSEMRSDVADMMDIAVLHEANSPSRNEAVQKTVESQAETDSSVPAAVLQLMIEFPSPEKLDPTDDDTQVAFGRYTKRELHEGRVNYDPKHITPELVDFMSHDSLYGVFYVARPLPGQRRPEGFYVNGILLNNYEYVLVPRSVEAIGRLARARFLNKKDVVDQTAVDSSERYIMHLFEDSTIPSLDAHRSALEQRQKHIRALHSMAKEPGLRRFKAVKVKDWYSQAWQELDNIVDVLQVHENWTQEQRQGAEAVILSRLITGSSRDRVEGWNVWLGFIDRYLEARIHLLKTTSQETNRELERLATEYANKRPA